LLSPILWAESKGSEQEYHAENGIVKWKKIKESERFGKSNQIIDLRHGWYGVIQ
jgi:hypothetical protein